MICEFLSPDRCEGNIFIGLFGFGFGFGVAEEVRCPEVWRAVIELAS